MRDVPRRISLCVCVCVSRFSGVGALPGERTLEDGIAPSAHRSVPSHGRAASGTSPTLAHALGGQIEIWPISARLWLKRVRIRSSLGEIWPNPATCGRTGLDFDRTQPSLRRSRSKFGRPSRWPEFGRVHRTFGRPESNSADPPPKVVRNPAHIWSGPGPNLFALSPMSVKPMTNVVEISQQLVEPAPTLGS